VHGDLEPVAGEAELADDLGTKQRQGVRTRRRAHAGPKLLGHTRAADDVAALEALDRESGARQVGGGDQAVVAGADDGDVEHVGEATS
jgi:hypothetical protein